MKFLGRLATSLLGAICVSILIHLVSSNPSPVSNFDEHVKDGLATAFIGFCVVAPLLESVLLALCIKLLNFFTVSKYQTVVFLTATALAALHAAVSLRWALIVFPSFLVFASVYLIELQATNNRRAFIEICMLHAAQNTLALLAGILL